MKKGGQEKNQQQPTKNNQQSINGRTVKLSSTSPQLADLPMTYYTIEELLLTIDEPNASKCLELLAENRQRFQVARGSTNNHQAWVGGYIDHIQEIMNIAHSLYDHLNGLRPLPFSRSDILLVTFLHDLEKPWVYEQKNSGEWVRVESMNSKEAQQAFRKMKLQEYNIELTSEQEDAIKYIEGEHQDYTNRRRVMSPLAAFCHLADVASARLWFDRPMAQNDPWAGASRIRK